MLLAFSTDAEMLSRLEAVLRDVDNEIHLTSDWNELAHRWDLADVVIVDLQQLEGGATRLAALRLGRPFIPLVVVAPERVDVLRGLAGVSIDAFVSIEAIEGTLKETVWGLVGCNFFERVADLVKATPGISDELREAVVGACAAGADPYQSVERFSRESGLDRRRLARVLQQSVGGLEGIRFEDVLDGIFLVHATRLRETLGSWDRVAEVVGRQRKTLREMVRRLLGWDLRTLHLVGWHEVARHVLQRVILPALRPRRPTRGDA